MSCYYTYYLGYRKDGKIYPFGPFDKDGRFQPVFYCSSSFASDLHNDFYFIIEDEFSDELREVFQYKDYDNNLKLREVKILDYKDLPSGSFIRSGYYLVRDVEKYQKDEDCWDIFYECMDPTIYAERLKNEIVLGPPKTEKDCEGNDVDTYTCGDYMYFCYPDYHCREYESWVIREMLDILKDYNIEDYVVLLIEG